MHGPRHVTVSPGNLQLHAAKQPESEAGCAKLLTLSMLFSGTAALLSVQHKLSLKHCMHRKVMLQIS